MNDYRTWAVWHIDLVSPPHRVVAQDMILLDGWWVAHDSNGVIFGIPESGAHLVRLCDDEMVTALFGEDMRINAADGKSFAEQRLLARVA